LGVAEDFRAFRNNYLISVEKIISISSRYKRITRQLNKDFYYVDSQTSHSLYVGSYGRDTAVDGISDLDIGFQLPFPIYNQYNLYMGNGQSALLQAVKKSLSNTYSSSDVGGDGQVVVIDFSDGITFEILPYFVSQSNTWTYPYSKNGGTWKTCNPRAEIEAIKRRSDSTNKNLKHLCRMVRVWKNVQSVPMSGMLIDTLAYQFIESWPYSNKSYSYHDFMMRDFFELLSRQNQTQLWWRAPGSGSTVARKGVFEHKARNAYLRACEAIQYNDDNHQWSRRQKWREIFGSQYPA
jgi:Second Messenger Oligonucleotide or Dinucleotide Synthetase domain